MSNLEVKALRSIVKGGGWYPLLHQTTNLGDDGAPTAYIRAVFYLPFKCRIKSAAITARDAGSNITANATDYTTLDLQQGTTSFVTPLTTATVNLTAGTWRTFTIDTNGDEVLAAGTAIRLVGTASTTSVGDLSTYFVAIQLGIEPA